MRKSLIITMLLLFSFILFGCTIPQTEYNVYNLTEENDSIITTNTSVENETAESFQKITPQFRDTDYSLLGSKVTLNGFLFDAEIDQPMEGASIYLVCNGERQYNTSTDNNGSFSLSFIIFNKGECIPGNLAWAEVVSGGRKYRSEAIIIPKLEFFGGGGGGGGGSNGGGSSSGSSTNSNSETPEENCTDGIQNQDEEGVDCGGVCDPCSNPDPETSPEPETCYDGIQNQDEEGIDCGGSCPDECSTTQSETTEETCDDGIQNQDEEGIDCGGSCNECSNPQTPEEPIQEVPEFSTITATLALIGAGVYCLRKRK